MPEQPVEPAAVCSLRHLKTYPTLSDAFNQGQALFADPVALARLQEMIGQLSGDRYPDFPCQAIDPHACCPGKAKWLPLVQAELAGTDIDFHGALLIDRGGSVGWR